jgi:hypothetical protein
MEPVFRVCSGFAASHFAPPASRFSSRRSRAFPTLSAFQLSAMTGVFNPALLIHR